MITLRQLRYLEALARTGHFGRAANECAVTQPALSMQIRELEVLLGVTLVERSRSKCALTLEGEGVVERARRVLTDVGDIVDYARQRQGGLSGPLRLGVIPTIAPYLLPKILPAMRQKYPDLELRVRETQTDRLIDALEQGRLDLLLLALPVERKDVQTHALFEDRFLAAMPPGAVELDTKTKPGRISLERLAEEELLLLEEGHCLRDQALDYCAMVRPEMMSRFGATSLATLLALVANGHGATLIPELCTEAEARDPRIKLLRFIKPEPYRLIGLAWRRSSPRRTAFEALGEVIQAARSNHPSIR